MALNWTKKEINKFKSHIENKRVNVVTDLDEARKRAEGFTTGDTVNAIYSSHMADASTDQEEMEKNYYWMGRENKFIQYLNRALEMLEKGDFGVCATCGELINKERLEEVPHTTSCFDCKTQEV